MQHNPLLENTFHPELAVPSCLGQVFLIEAGEFIEMAELLSDRLKPTRALFTDEADQQKQTNRSKPVTNILEWFCPHTFVVG